MAHWPRCWMRSGTRSGRSAWAAPGSSPAALAARGPDDERCWRPGDPGLDCGLGYGRRASPRASPTGMHEVVRAHGESGATARPDEAVGYLSELADITDGAMTP